MEMMGGECLSIFISVVIFVMVFIILVPDSFFKINSGRLTHKKSFLKTEGYLYKTLGNMLERAGLEQLATPREILFRILVYAVAGGAAGLTLYSYAYGGNGIGAALMIAFLAGSLPVFGLKSDIEKRKRSMERELPAMLTTMAVITDAGLNLLQAIKELTVYYQGDLSCEFKKVIKQVEMGKPVSQALEEMAQKARVPELNMVTGVIVQALRKGSGITGILREQAGACWQRRKNSARELGEKASARLFIPAYLLVFPAVGLMILTPAVINVILAFTGR